ncbi:MAG: Hsp20/alpha crystallin family protein [Halieaceae bacterium]|jgi:HSP20 family protein|nr:Hsp20/alpha crystallin family protein [Halieaceae bacterium]
MSLIPRGSFFDSDRFVDDFWAPLRREGEATSAFFAPRVDIKDKDDHFEITAELPGVAKDDIHLTLADGVLTLEAEARQEDKEEKDGKVIRQERRYGKLMRSFNLGSEVHDDDISADFKDGVLTLKAPKRAEPAPTTRRISVN